MKTNKHPKLTPSDSSASANNSGSEAKTPSVANKVHLLNSVSPRSIKYRWAVMSLKYKLLLLLTGILILAVAGLYITQMQHDKPTAKASLSSNLVHQNYSALSPDELNKLLKRTLGYDLEYLKTHKLTQKLLRDFAGAYIAAQSLQRAGLNDKALEAYKIAAKLNANDSDEQFYQDYAGAALISGDMNLWKQQISKLRSLIMESSRTNANKSDRLEELDSQIKIVESEK